MTKTIAVTMRQISKHNILFQKILQLQQATPVRHEIKFFLRVRHDRQKFENHWVKVINIFFTFPNKFNLVAYIYPRITRKRYDELA